MGVEAHDTLVRKLRSLARRRRAIVLARGATALVAAFLLTMGAVALLDRFVVMPEWLRATLGLSSYLIVLAVLWRVAARFVLRPSRPTDWARWLGDARPHLRDPVLSAVELGRPGADAKWDSPALRAAALTKAARQIEPVRPGDVFPWRLALRWTVAAVVAVALGGVLLAIPTLRFDEHFHRAVLPLAALDRPSNVLIELVEPTRPEEPVPQGEPVRVSVRIGGEAVDEVTLKPGSGEPIAMSVEEAGLFAAQVQVGREPLTLTIEAGDARRTLTLDARPRPRVTTFAKTYRYPDYTGLSAKQVSEETGDLAALEGSTAELTLAADQPIREGKIVVEHDGQETPQPLVIGTDGRQLKASLPIAVSATYRVELVSADTGFENKFSPRYEIRAEPDLRPTARIDEPVGTREAQPGETIELRGKATDDLGLTAVIQAVQVNGSAWVEHTLSRERKPEIAVERSWDLSALKLRPGDEVTTKLIAVDLKGNRGESEPARIVVAAPDGPVPEIAAGQIAEKLTAIATEADKLHAAATTLAANTAGDEAEAGGLRELKASQEQLDAKVTEALDALRRDAEGQDLLTDAGRERSRDADDARAMLREPATASDRELSRAMRATDAGPRNEALRAASEQQQRLAHAARQAAEHYRHLDTGQAEPTRTALRAGEAPLGIKPALDAQYGQLERLSELADASPESLRRELEEELRRNPAMRRELGAIAERAVAEARSDLEQAADREARASRALAGEARGDTNPIEQAKREQPAVQAALDEAAKDLERAKRHHKRLDQSERASEAQEARRRTEALASQKVPEAQRALDQARQPADARPQVEQTARAIREEAEALSKSEPREQAAGEPNDSQTNSKSEAQTPQQADASRQPGREQERNDSQDQAPAGSESSAQQPGENPSEGSAQQSEKAEGQQSPQQQASAQKGQQGQSQAGDSQKGQSPGEKSLPALTPEASRSLAKALDQLEREALGQEPAASLASAANAASSESPTGDEGRPNAAGEPSGEASAQMDASGDPSQAGSPGQPGQQPSGTPSSASAQASAQSSPQPNGQAPQGNETANASTESSAAASDSSGQQGQPSEGAAAGGRSVAAASGEPGAAASVAVREAAMAQARALNASRSGREGSSSNSPDSQRVGGSGSASQHAADEAMSIDQIGGAASDNNWGRLKTQIAEDLLRGRHGNVSGEYRESVEAYFRSIAQRAGGRVGEP